MKRIVIYSISGLSFLAVTSCNIENIDTTSSDPRVKMEFYAGLQTKTAIDETGTVTWSAGDAISVFDGTYNNKFDLKSGAGESSASFEGSAMPGSGYVALYPYSASARLLEGSIVSTLPAEQYSTAEGTFDTMLNPSVAKAEGNSLTFHNVASLIRINVQTAEGKSISEIQVKAKDRSLAGDYAVSITDNGFSAIGSGTVSESVRLIANDGGALAAGPYYLAVLPDSYDGFTLNIIFTDGSYFTKEYTTPVDLVAGKGISINVDATTATENTQGLYGLFMAGQDIFIGGKAYNKSQFDDSQIMFTNSSTSIINIYNNSTQYGDGKIIFLGPQATATFGNAGNIIVVGTDPENKPTVTKTQATNLNDYEGGNRVVFANVNLDTSPLDETAVNYAFVANTAEFEELSFDNCDITLPSAKSFIVVSSSGKSIFNISFNDCKIKVPSGSSNRFIIHTASCETTTHNAAFKNNIFYCPDGIASGFRLISGSTNDGQNQTTVTEFHAENNTFINTAPSNSALIIAESISSATFRNNIFHIDQTQENNRNMIRCKMGTGAYPAVAECINNFAYDMNNSAYNMFYQSSYIPETGIVENPAIIGDSPFSNLEISTGTYTLKAEYSSYGAQR